MANKRVHKDQFSVTPFVHGFAILHKIRNYNFACDASDEAVEKPLSAASLR